MSLDPLVRADPGSLLMDPVRLTNFGVRCFWDWRWGRPRHESAPTWGIGGGAL